MTILVILSRIALLNMTDSGPSTEPVSGNFTYKFTTSDPRVFMRMSYKDIQDEAARRAWEAAAEYYGKPVLNAMTKVNQSSPS